MGLVSISIIIHSIQSTLSHSRILILERRLRHGKALTIPMSMTDRPKSIKLHVDFFAVYC